MKFNSALLRQCRLEWGWTQEAAAAALNIDVTTYRKYERSKVNKEHFEINRRDRYNLLHKIAEVFELPQPELLLIADRQEEAAEILQLFHPDTPVVELVHLPPQPPGAAYDASWYVERACAERAALAYLDRPGLPVVVWGPQWFGKTWLVCHVIERWRASLPPRSLQLVRINLEEIESDARHNYDVFLHECGCRILAELPEAGDLLLEEAWQRDGGPNLKLTWLLRKLLGSSERLLLCIDQADAILDEPYSDDFFGMLRALASKPGEPWNRLRIALAVSTTPLLLTKTINNSPFHGLTQPIELDSLLPSQIAKLGRRYHLALQDEESALLASLLGGHPYFTRLVLNTVAQGQQPLKRILEQPLASGLFSSHLRYIKSIVAQNPRLACALAKLSQGREKELSIEEYEPLCRCGVLSFSKEGQLGLRAELYRALLGPA